jgi:hypothetical protein
MSKPIPDVVFLTVKSISSAALETVKPGTLGPWISGLEDYVNKMGRFTKFEVMYVPVSPPPFFYDYKCRKCRWWIQGGSCQMVDGLIVPRGWCAIWVPPDSYKPFTWPQELLKGDW